MTDSSGLAQRLITARSIQGLSQHGLAEASGVAAAQVSRYESGKSAPRPEVVAKLSKSLGVDFDWLLTGSGPAPAGIGGFPARAVFYGDPNSVVVPLTSDLHRQLVKAAESGKRDLIKEIISRLEMSFLGNPHLTLTERREIAALEEQVASLRAKKADLRAQIEMLIERARSTEQVEGESLETADLFSRIGQLAWDEANLKAEHDELMARLDSLRGEDRPPAADDT